MNRGTLNTILGVLIVLHVASLANNHGWGIALAIVGLEAVALALTANLFFYVRNYFSNGSCRN